MGTDTPVAALSDRSRLLYDYFGQLFAQVTNPPLDAIREELVTSLGRTFGPEQNLLQAMPASCRQVFLPFPVIDNDELAKILHIDDDGDLPGYAAVRITGHFDVNGGGTALAEAIEQLRTKVSKAIAAGARIIVLSDRDCDEKRAPIPSLLMTAAVHHHLVREKTRMEVGLVVESGDCREVHHVALLLGYGAAAVNPYLAFESIEDLIRDGELTGVEPGQAVRNMVKALGKGVLKVMSKMGISTVGLVHDGADLRGRRAVPGPRRRVLHRHLLPARRRRHRRPRRGGGHAPPPRLPGEPHRAGAPPAGDRRGVPVAPRGRGAPVQPRDGVPAPARHPVAAVRRLREVHADRRQAVGGGRHAARALHAEDRRAAAGADRGGRAGQRDRQAVLHRRDELRLDLRRGAPDARDRHEPAGRQVQHR